MGSGTRGFSVRTERVLNAWIEKSREVRGGVMEA